MDVVTRLALLGCYSILLPLAGCGSEDTGSGPSSAGTTGVSGGAGAVASGGTPSTAGGMSGGGTTSVGTGGVLAGGAVSGGVTGVTGGSSGTTGSGGSPGAGAGGAAAGGDTAGGNAGGGMGGASTGGGSAADTGGTPSGGAGAANAGSGGGLIWPNETSKANSDPWLSENHDAITQLRPKVLVINLESVSESQAETLVDRHVAALSEASSFHKYKDDAAQPTVVYELLKIVSASKGGSINYNSWNTQEFADSNLQIKDPADPSGKNLTLCELFEQGVINEVWCMASSNPKCGETQEAKQVYDMNGNKVAGMFRNVSNGDNITGLGCKVTARITDFNNGRGAGCHLHAMGHAWERYMDSSAVPTLAKQASRFLNWDLDSRVGAPFSNFYSACTSNGTQLTDCLIWESQIRVRSGPSARSTFDIADMSEGCGNAHFYPNTTGTYSYDANMPDPEVLTSCENYGLHNGPDGKDLTTTYTNAMTDMLYGRSGGNCPADQPACDDDCGGHGTTYLYQNFPGPGTAATNEDGTPMHNWWVYLFY